MVNFAQYKKNHKKLTEKLSSKLNSLNKKGYEQEEGFWQPSVDKAGNGWAIIRFLPAGNGEEDPFVQMISYAFQGPSGLWYIEKSRETMDEDDPCGEYRTKLWAAKDEEGAKKLTRKKQFISNILVIKDPEHPENNGKVFLFR